MSGTLSRSLHPVHELADLAVDDRLGLLDRRAARVEVGADDAGQVVDGVEEHVVELGDLRLDVARHREVDHEHRPPAARAQRALDQSLAEDRQRGRGARHHDVVFVQLLGERAQLDRLAR
jgi:hypothetical protein